MPCLGTRPSMHHYPLESIPVSRSLLLLLPPTLFFLLLLLFEVVPFWVLLTLGLAC